MSEAAYDPWDKSPTTEEQKSYFRELLIDMANVDLDRKESVIMRDVITTLNEARRKLGIPFREYAT